MADERMLEIVIQVEEQGGDAEQLDLAARQLRSELLEWGAAQAELASGEAPPGGAKGVEPLIAGMLAATLLQTMLPGFLQFLHAWALRRENRAVKIKFQAADGAALEIEVPQTMQRAEVQAWIEMARAATAKQPKRKK